MVVLLYMVQYDNLNKCAEFCVTNVHVKFFEYVSVVVVKCYCNSLAIFDVSFSLKESRVIPF